MIENIKIIMKKTVDVDVNAYQSPWDIEDINTYNIFSEDIARKKYPFLIALTYILVIPTTIGVVISGTIIKEKYPKK